MSLLESHDFAGGVIYSLIDQLQNKDRGELDLAEAVSWGVVAGGFTRFYLGGTYFEKTAGEKLTKLAPFFNIQSNAVLYVERAETALSGT